MSLREFLADIGFDVAYDGDNILTTCNACGDRTAFTYHEADQTIIKECQDHAEQCLGI
jgi:hypothetical protein